MILFCVKRPALSFVSLSIALFLCARGYAKSGEIGSSNRKKRPGLGMVGLCKTEKCTFTMGGDEKSGSPGTRYVELKYFKIDRTSVTNKMFRLYVKETKYKTESERFGWR